MCFRRIEQRHLMFSGRRSTSVEGLTARRREARNPDGLPAGVERFPMTHCAASADCPARVIGLHVVGNLSAGLGCLFSMSAERHINGSPAKRPQEAFSCSRLIDAFMVDRPLFQRGLPEWLPPMMLPVLPTDLSKSRYRSIPGVDQLAKPFTLHRVYCIFLVANRIEICLPRSI